MNYHYLKVIGRKLNKTKLNGDNHVSYIIKPFLKNYVYKL